MDARAHAETDATPERIWAVLSDIDHWTVWDTSMEAMSGLIADAKR